MAKELIASVQEQLINVIKHFELKRKEAVMGNSFFTGDRVPEKRPKAAEQDIVDRIIEQWKKKNA